jgi:hypothetical protein
MRFAPLLLLVMLSSTGCTSLALRRNTVSQIESTTDLRYKAVLDNLAMLNDSPHSLPSYSVMLAGTTKILDQGSIGSASNIGRETVGKAGATITHLQTETLDIPAQRGISENWTLDPVTSPEKLKAIRMACWWVLFGKESVLETDDIHLGGNPRKENPLNDLNDRLDPAKRGYYFDVASDLEKLPRDWLHHGEWKDVPPGAAYKAQSNGKWIWVMPEGMEGLSRFTLIIQNLSRLVTDQVYYPRAVTRTIQLTTAIDGKTVAFTFYVDEASNPVADAASYAYPVKRRLETIVNDPSLKSQIAASSSGR